jgi:penicillin amidase
VTWWQIFKEKLWDEFDTLKYSYRKPNSYNTYLLIKENKDLEYYDILKTNKKESLSDLVNYTYQLSVDSLENWKKNNDNKLNWKDYKNTTIKHLLNIKSFSKSGVDVGGYSNIINAANEDHGPSWRMIVKLNNIKTEAWGVYPGGQSGNPGNSNYFSLIDDWGHGIYKKLIFNNNYIDNRKNIIYEKKFNN